MLPQHDKLALILCIRCEMNGIGKIDWYTSKLVTVVFPVIRICSNTPNKQGLCAGIEYPGSEQLPVFYTVV